MKNQYDVIIIGAGASGLSCALELLKEKKSVLLLEARDRVGGRGFTLNSDHSVPSEMGAEFIHGAPKSILAQIQALDLSFYDVQDLHHYQKRGRLQMDPHFWDGLQKMVAKIPRAVRSQDQSVSDFLIKQKSESRFQREIFRAFVEGFHAADIKKMSAKGFYETEEASSEESLGGVELFRLQKGYSDFFKKVLEAHPDLAQVTRLNHVVTEVQNKSPSVGIICRNEKTGKSVSLTSRFAVLTLPLSLLKSSLQTGADFQWTPEPPKGLEAVIDSMEMGHVQKIVFYFKNRFWEKLLSKGPAFIHTEANSYFPTWWTTLPVRSTQWTAWQGGPKAFEMTTWSQAKKVSVALETFSGLIKKPVSFLEGELIDALHHDWYHDPFSHGAYSYIKTGGVEKSKKLRHVFEGKYIFAGEATAPGAARGTIHGAWDSGVRAAQQVLKSL